MKKNKSLLSLILILPFLIGSKCDRGTLFKEISTEFSYPISIAVDASQNRAYVVNANNDVQFTSTTLSVLDISNPASPKLLDHINNPFRIPDFSGQIYLDTTNRFAYVPNRYSTDLKAMSHSLLKIDLDETVTNETSNLGHYESFTTGESPFGIACCDLLGRMYVVNYGGNDPGSVSVFDPQDLSKSVKISLQLTLKSGEDFLGRNSTEVALLGHQAFVTNRSGRLYVINTDDVGVDGANPIDAILLGGRDFRGIATDGTLLYVVDGRSDARVLHILDPTKITIDQSAVNEFEIVNNDENQANTIKTTTVALGKNPNEAIVFKGKVYVTNQDDDTVSVIDINNPSAALTPIAVGDQPYALTAFTSPVDSKDYLYVTNLGSNSLSVIDLGDNNKVVNTFTP